MKKPRASKPVTSAFCPQVAVISAHEFQKQLGTGHLAVGALPQFAPAGGVSTPAKEKAKGKTAALKPQIRIPKARKITGVEAAWMEECRLRWNVHQHKDLRIVHEPFTLHLPSGTKYTPDVGVFTVQDQRCLALYEVKDEHIHDPKGSLRAFKEALAAHPYFPLQFVQRRQGQWLIAKAPADNP